eukprot:gnl/TRDRNA2_/TRDRNA2_30481_c0_seq1.p1 gnl/TRDRNA2_/TRDRNA2_30481_c0~~gnl/TRDRNA2_/TRDRNA2_30481_c0_seq1.p1  ORF type:complete len:291 (+),score=45.38 gnl/TRDRNA2_/TRDRNA2_30481_c0_seq1:93-875(+)
MDKCKMLFGQMSDEIRASVPPRQRPCVLPSVDQNMPWGDGALRKDGVNYTASEEDLPCRLEEALRISGFSDPHWRMIMGALPRHSTSVFVNLTTTCASYLTTSGPAAAMKCVETTVEQSIFLSPTARHSTPSQESYFLEGEMHTPRDSSAVAQIVAREAGASLLRDVQEAADRELRPGLQARLAALAARYWAFDGLSRGCDEMESQNFREATGHMRGALRAFAEIQAQGSDAAVVQEAFDELLEPLQQLRWCGRVNPLDI